MGVGKSQWESERAWVKFHWKTGEIEPEWGVGQGETGQSSWGDSPRVCRAVCYPTFWGCPPCVYGKGA